MIFSCTKKVLERVKKFKTIESSKEDTGLYNWYVDQINITRKNYFLFTNSQTLFSFFVYAGTKKEIDDLEHIFTQKLKEQIIRDIGVSGKYMDYFESNPTPSTFHKTNSRSILGSMNDFKYLINACLWEWGGLEEYDRINHALNENLLGALKYARPKDKMKEALLALNT